MAPKMNLAKAKKAPHEYSKNPNTIRARKRKLRMDARTKAETQARTADHKAIHRQLEILADTESFQRMSLQERGVRCKEVERARMEIRRKKGIDAESKLKRFDSEQAAAAAAEADGSENDPADDDNSIADDSVRGVADNDGSPDGGLDGSVDGNNNIVVADYQELDPLSPPNEDGFVEAELPLGEGGAPPRPMPLLQDYMFKEQDQQAPPPGANVSGTGPVPVATGPIPAATGGVVQAGQPQGAAENMFQQMDNRLKAMVQAEIQTSVAGRLDAMQATLNQLAASFHPNAGFLPENAPPMHPALAAHDQGYGGAVHGQVSGQADGLGYNGLGFDNAGYQAQYYDVQGYDDQTSGDADDSVYPPLGDSGNMMRFG